MIYPPRRVYSTQLTLERMSIIVLCMICTALCLIHSPASIRYVVNQFTLNQLALHEEHVVLDVCLFLYCIATPMSDNISAKPIIMTYWSHLVGNTSDHLRVVSAGTCCCGWFLYQYKRNTRTYSYVTSCFGTRLTILILAIQQHWRFEWHSLK